MLLHLLLACVRIYLRMTSESSGPHQKLQLHDFHSQLVTFCPDNCPFPRLPFFPEYSRYSVVPPDPLATAFHPSKNAIFAVACAALSFSWYSVALLLASLRNSSPLDSPHSQSHASGRKNRTAAQQIPKQNPRKHLHNVQSPQKKRKQAHQSQQAPQTHPPRDSDSQ